MALTNTGGEIMKDNGGGAFEASLAFGSTSYQNTQNWRYIAFISVTSHNHAWGI